MAETDNGWQEYKRLVLKQLEDLTAEVKGLRNEIEELKICGAVNKTKMAFYGTAFGFGAGLVANLILVILKLK